MSGRIVRLLYRGLLGLHPEPFRIEFGAEMMDIFEATVADQGASFVLADVIRSAARQQIRYHTAPPPLLMPLYFEVPSAPDLAGVFASTVLVLILAITAGMGEEKRKPREFRIINANPTVAFFAAPVAKPTLVP